MEFKVECSKQTTANDLPEIVNIWATYVCIYKTAENVIS